ncbi:hypothetical protein AAVH_05068 [Aphelenchoides avenae]|nr:hypothetical protein AAVH_05068 [Aphelenchus avenae]
MLLAWNPKRNAGYKGLLRNAFGAVTIAIVMASSYFYCMSALHETLIPGVDFHSYMDMERGLIDATDGLQDRITETMTRILWSCIP